MKLSNGTKVLLAVYGVAAVVVTIALIKSNGSERAKVRNATAKYEFTKADLAAQRLDLAAQRLDLDAQRLRNERELAKVVDGIATKRVNDERELAKVEALVAAARAGKSVVDAHEGRGKPEPETRANGQAS